MLDRVEEVVDADDELLAFNTSATIFRTHPPVRFKYELQGEDFVADRSAAEVFGEWGFEVVATRERIPGLEQRVRDEGATTQQVQLVSDGWKLEASLQKGIAIEMEGQRDSLQGLYTSQGAVLEARVNEVSALENQLRFNWLRPKIIFGLAGGVNYDGTPIAGGVVGIGYSF